MPSLTRILITAAALSTLATAALASDRSFLKKALEGDNSEMTLGQMAVDNGASKGTRDFGQMLHDDHSAAKQKALVVAQAHGLSDTDAMAPEAKMEQRKLKRLHGAAFDREFARYMVKDHKHDIADFEKEARTDDKATAELARDTLPDLKKHLETATALTKAR